MRLSSKKMIGITGWTFLIVISLLLIAVALLPWLPPGKFWYISLLGMGYPFLVLAAIILITVMAIRRSKAVFIPLVALLLNWQQLPVMMGWHFGGDEEKPAGAQTISVLSWNVSRWTEGRHSIKEKQGNSFRTHMFDVVQLQNADILCFQEFFECFDPKYYPSNIAPLKKMGYPYVYFSPSSKLWKDLFQSGLAIFSKYPITDTGFLKQFDGGHSEGFSWADIKIDDKTIRVFNTHLESPGLRNPKPGKAGGISGKMQMIKKGYHLRGLQADLLRDRMDESPNPVIFCGDVADVPNSYAYFKVRGNMQDAFLKKGGGFGKTYRSALPNVRIDYIMAGKEFSVLDFQNLPYRYSDHYPMLTVLELKN